MTFAFPASDDKRIEYASAVLAFATWLAIALYALGWARPLLVESRKPSARANER